MVRMGKVSNLKNSRRQEGAVWIHSHITHKYQELFIMKRLALSRKEERGEKKGRYKNASVI